VTTDNKLSIVITGQLDLKVTQKKISQQLNKLKKENINVDINFQPDKLNKLNATMRKQVISYEQWWANALSKEEKLREQVLQTEQRIRKRIEQLQIQQQQRDQKAAENYANWWAKAIKDRELREERLNQRLSAQQAKAQLGLNVYQDKAGYDSTRLLQNAGKFVDQQALREWALEVQRLTVNTPRLQQEMARLNERFRQISTSAMDAKKSTYSFTEQLGHAFNKMALWGAAGSIFFGAQQALEALLTTIVEIDTKLTEMSKVLSTDTNFNELMSDTVELANTYGRSLTEAQDALIEFGKAGFEADQALQMTNATLLGANVTGLKTGQMAEYLTGALIQFNLTAEESTRVIDKLNEVDNNFSVTSLGLAQSIAKAGESAQAFGVTLDELIGMTTAIGQATRESGNVIGNSLKTVFARLNMDKTQEALGSIGVAVKDLNGDLRTATDIYADVATQWGSLTRAQKTYVAESLAGKYHITRMMALIENWDTVNKAAETSQNSLGSSMEENRKHMESLSSAINKVTAAGQELAFVIGEAGLRDAMFSVLNTTATFIKGLTALKDNSTGVVIALTAITASVTAMSLATSGAVRTVPLLSAAFTGLRNAVTGATLAVMRHPVGLLAVGIATATTGIITYLGKQKELNEEIQKLDQSAAQANLSLKKIEETLSLLGSTTKQDIFDYDKTISNLEQVKQKLNEVVKAEQEYINHAKELDPSFSLDDVGLDPDQISQELKDLAQTAGINILQFATLGEAVAAVDKKLKEMAETSVELKNNDFYSTFEKANEKALLFNNAIDKLQNGASLTYEEMKRLIDAHEGLSKEIDFTKTSTEEMVKVLSKYASTAKEDVTKAMETYQQKLKEQRAAFFESMAMYDIEISKIQEYALKRDQLLTNINKKVTDGKMSADAARYAAQGYDAQAASVQNLENKVKEYQNVLSTFGKSGQVTSSSSAKQKSTSAKSTYAPLTHEAKELLRIETELSKVQNQRQLLSDSSLAYRDSLKQEKDLQEQKLKLLIKEYEQVTKTKVLNGKVHSNKFPAKLSDDALKKAYDLQKEIDQLQNQINTLSFDEINSSLKEFADKNDYLDSRIKLIQERMGAYSKTSQEYRDAIEEESNHLRLKQDNLHEEAELIRNQLAYGKLSVAQRDELNEKLLELQSNWLNLQNTIDTKKLEQINSLLGQQKNKTDDLSKSIELSKAKMDAIGDSSSEQYLTEYVNYLQLMSLKKQSLQEEINLREKLIQQNLHNIDLVRQYKNEIVDLQIEQIRLQEAVNQATADKIIDTYKRVYEEQKNAALKALENEEKKENERHKKKLDRIEDERKKKEKAIQKEIEAIDDARKAEDERHKAAMDALDEEMDKFNEAIDKRLQLIDRQSSEREYDNELEKLQSERQKLQEQINTLSLDDSYEAKLRLSELNEQLATKDKEIEDLNYKRSTELRKDNLEDQRDAYEKDINAKKKAEQAKYDEAVKKLELEKRKLDQQLTYYKDYYDKLIQKENEKHDNILAKLQKEKEETERHFNELIADEKRYADMRKAILAGNLTAMQGDLAKFEQFVKDNMSAIGNSIAQNLLAKIEESKKALESLNNINIGVGGGGSGSSGGSGGNSGGGKGNGTNPEWKKYKSQVNEIVYNKGLFTEAQKKNDQKGMDEASRKAEKYYSQLPSDLESLLRGMDYKKAFSWYKGNFHVGGIVDGKSDRLTEIVNKMFNLRPDEGIAKVLQGELWTTPKNIAQNFVPNLKNLMSSITPVVNLSTATGGSGDTPININIERFMGTETDFNKLKNFVMNSVVQANKKKGR
jgi:TP901 family phage tail tape measure protein